MDLADIPAAAAFLRVEQPTACVAETARSAPPPSAAAASRLPGAPEHSSAMAMDPNATTAAATAALLGAAHFYPAADASGHAAAMAQHYYAQNLASFANVASSFMSSPMAGFMPMGMFGGAPSFLTGGGSGPPPAFPRPPSSFLGAPMAAAAPPPPPLYDMDASALQYQIAAQFTQATPEQQTIYYEGIRQQLDNATSGLNDTQKQALLRMDPSLSFSMKPIELAHAVKQEYKHEDDASPPSTMTAVMPSEGVAGGGGGGGLKRARTSSNAAGGGTKKPRKNKASSCEPSPMMDGTGQLLLLNEDTPDGSSSSATTPRATLRGRPKGSHSAANAGVQYTASGKKKSMTPQAEEARARKAKMTWPKGTFLIRLQDVKVRNGRDHIWLVDNHQLLQRYNNETGGVRADGSRVYHKTDRYTGWLCHEGFHYFPLFDGQHVLRTDADTVTVLFPGEEDLQQAIDYQEQEKARRAEQRGADEPEARPLPPSIRDQPTRYAQMLQQQQQQQLEYQEQQRAHGTSSGTSMTAPQPFLRMKQEDDASMIQMPSSLMMAGGDGGMETSSSMMMTSSMKWETPPSMMESGGGMMMDGGQPYARYGRREVKQEPGVAMGGGGGRRAAGMRTRSQTVSLASPSCSTTAVVGGGGVGGGAAHPAAHHHPQPYPGIMVAAALLDTTTTTMGSRPVVKHEMPSLDRQDYEWPIVDCRGATSSASGARRDVSDEEMHALSETMLLDEDILDEERDARQEVVDESLADHTYTSRMP